MEKFIHEFGINWKLLVAQIINFAVVVFVLAKFVYKPMVKMLDQRTKKIEDGISFADKAKKELDRVEVLKHEELKKAEAQGQQIVNAAEKDAKKVADDITKGAEREKERIVATGITILKEQKAQMESSFYQQAAGVVKEALGKVLAKGDFDKAEATLINEALNEVKVK